jgi:CheY-like chemotaxis protein
VIYLMAHILVVDDEPMFRFLVASILRPLGYQVTEAEDGLDALLILKEQSFDLLLTDLMMPRMNGVQLIEEVSKHFPQLPIVVMSAFANTAPETVQPYVKHYLKKPITKQQLVDTMSEFAVSSA